MWTPLPDTHRSQRGVTLIWMAFFLLVMIAFVGLGVDMARLMATRNQLQGAADAAALAGASAYETSSGDSNAVIAAVVARASEWALKNRAFEGAPTSVSVPEEDVVTNYAQETVTVTTRREGTTGMVTYFVRVIPELAKLTMRATATAKAGGGCRFVPFAVQPPDSQTFEPESTYLMKNAPPDGTQGSYWAVQFPDCPSDPCQDQGGAAQYLCWLTEGYPCCDAVQVGACLESKTGNMSGPTTAGIQTLIDTDTDQRLGILYDLTHTDPDAYHGNGRRVVMAPITAGVGTGGCSSKQYPVVALGVFFLTRPADGSGTNNTVYGEYLGTPEQLGMASEPFSVRLIK
jgi:Flp pilus assembly protein TadG